MLWPWCKCNNIEVRRWAWQWNPVREFIVFTSPLLNPAMLVGPDCVRLLNQWTFHWTCSPKIFQPDTLLHKLSYNHNWKLALKIILLWSRDWHFFFFIISKAYVLFDLNYFLKHQLIYPNILMLITLDSPLSDYHVSLLLKRKLCCRFNPLRSVYAQNHMS